MDELKIINEGNQREFNNKISLIFKRNYELYTLLNIIASIIFPLILFLILIFIRNSIWIVIFKVFGTALLVLSFHLLQLFIPGRGTIVKQISMLGNSLPECRNLFIDSIEKYSFRKMEILQDNIMEEEDYLEFIKIKSKKINHNKTIIYYGLASIPFSFYLGYKLKNYSQIEIFNWKRNKRMWENSKEHNIILDLECIKDIKNQIDDEINLIISISYHINLNLVSDKNLNNLIITNKKIDLDVNYDYKTVYEFIRQQISEYSSNIKLINLYIACDNGFTFYLGQQFSDRNMPSVNIYQYGGRQLNKYLWYVDTRNEKLIRF